MRESAEGLKKILDPNKSKFLNMLPDGDFKNTLIQLLIVT